MISAKQRAANRANSLKSTGPRTDEGKVRAKLNATKHSLSLPVDERLFANEIYAIAELIQSDCDSLYQAQELAKRIIDFERNESYLFEFDEEALHDEIMAWASDPHRIALVQLAQKHRNKEAVSTTFTVPSPLSATRLKSKQRTEEIKVLEDYLKLQDKVLLGNLKAGKDAHASAQRYQKRAINQLVKGVRMVAKGEEF